MLKELLFEALWVIVIPCLMIVIGANIARHYGEINDK